MTDYKEKLDGLHQAAKRKARELDEKLNVTGMVEDTARAAGEAARRGAQTIAGGAGQLRAEAERFADDNNLRETAGKAVDEAKRRAKDAGKIIRDAAGPAGKKAEKVFDEAVDYATTATKFAGKGLRATRATAAGTCTPRIRFTAWTTRWASENPGSAPWFCAAASAACSPLRLWSSVLRPSCTRSMCMANRRTFSPCRLFSRSCSN